MASDKQGKEMVPEKKEQGIRHKPQVHLPGPLIPPRSALLVPQEIAKPVSWQSIYASQTESPCVDKAQAGFEFVIRLSESWDYKHVSMTQL